MDSSYRKAAIEIINLIKNDENLLRDAERVYQMRRNLSSLEGSKVRSSFENYAFRCGEVSTGEEDNQHGDDSSSSFSEVYEVVDEIIEIETIGSTSDEAMLVEIDENCKGTTPCEPEDVVNEEPQSSLETEENLEDPINDKADENSGVNTNGGEVESMIDERLNRLNLETLQDGSYTILVPIIDHEPKREEKEPLPLLNKQEPNNPRDNRMFGFRSRISLPRISRNLGSRARGFDGERGHGRHHDEENFMARGWGGLKRTSSKIWRKLR